MIFITGATGRVGQHLVKALLERGEKVRILAREKKIPFENVEVFYGDITNTNVLKNAVKGVDVIYHLAAVVDYLAPKELMYKVNVIGTKNILDVSEGKKFIYLSSTAAMGKNLKDNPANENTKCKPTDYYGMTKLEAESMVREKGGIIIRSVDIFGPGFTEGYNYVIRGLENGTLPIIGSGQNFIHWIHIDDLIQALLLAKDKGRPGEVYIVAGKEVKTLKECFELLCKYLNVKPPSTRKSALLAKLYSRFKVAKYKINKKRPDVIPAYVDKIISNRTFDISKAKRELGFDPKISYEQAAKEMVEEYIRSKELKEQSPQTKV